MPEWLWRCNALTDTAAAVTVLDPIDFYGFRKDKIVSCADGRWARRTGTRCTARVCRRPALAPAHLVRVTVGVRRGMQWRNLVIWGDIFICVLPVLPNYPPSKKNIFFFCAYRKRFSTFTKFLNSIIANKYLPFYVCDLQFATFKVPMSLGVMSVLTAQW